MDKIISITSDNVIEIKEVESIQYDTISTAVNGMIEVVSLNQDIDMWVNEEGKLIGLEPNTIATLIWNEVFPNKDVIMGNVLITGGADNAGNTTGLTEESINDIMHLIQEGINKAMSRKDNNE